MSRGVEVLIPLDVSGRIPKNPFVAQLCLSLREIDFPCHHGRFYLDAHRHFDIVNIHWPELSFLLHSRATIDRDDLRRQVDKIAARSTLVCTIHNLLPHRRSDGDVLWFYRYLFSRASAFVHLSESARAAFMEMYGSIVRDAEHRVIWHGDYAIYGPPIDRDQARRDLGIDGRKCILFLGERRREDELRLAWQVLRGLPKDWRVLWASRAASGLSLLGVNVPARVIRSVEFIRLGLDKRVAYKKGYLNEFEMVQWACAADVLFVPRPNNLNTGLIPFGITYDIPIVGSESGSGGEYLRSLKMPALAKTSGVGDWIQGIGIAAGLRGRYGGRTYTAQMLERLSWTRIAKEYVELFRSIT